MLNAFRQQSGLSLFCCTYRLNTKALESRQTRDKADSRSETNIYLCAAFGMSEADVKEAVFILFADIEVGIPYLRSHRHNAVFGCAVCLLRDV